MLILKPFLKIFLCMKVEEILNVTFVLLQITD